MLIAEKTLQIKRIRDYLGLTQQDFADRIGVNRVSVARWETGARAISLAPWQWVNLQNLLDRHGLTVSNFLE